jgi:tetratricopeptide (TPR) repeat protein
MSTCKSCGTELDAAAKFCPKCGAKVLAGPAFCTNCGQPLIPGAKFCAFCGTGVAAVAATAPAGGEAPAVTAESWRAQGEAFNQQKNFAEAVRCFTEAITKEPQNPLYYKLRGNAWNDLKEYAKAVADQSEAIQLDPNNGAYYNNRGSAYDGMNENEKALADYNKALALGGTVGRYYNRARLFYKLNNRPKAIADLEKAFELEPGNQRVITTLANLRNTGAQAAAAPDPSAAAGKTAKKWKAEGDTFYDDENYAEAVRCYSEAVKLDPGEAFYYYHRGISYDALGEIEKALEDCNKAVEFDPENAVYYNQRGLVYKRCNENEKALADYTEAIRLDQDGDDARNAYGNRALLFDKLKRHTEAIADYLAFHRLDPDNETIKTKLMERADELLRSGGSAQDPKAKKVAAAIDIYTAIIEQDESYPRVWTQRGLAKLLGVSYFDAEYLDDETFSNYKVALPDLDRAIEEDEEDGDAYAYRAEIHWRCGRNDDALEDLQRAFDLSAAGWVVTAGAMYDDGVELPEEILDGLRDEGYIESDDEDEEDEEDE